MCDAFDFWKYVAFRNFRRNAMRRIIRIDSQKSGRPVMLVVYTSRKQHKSGHVGSLHIHEICSRGCCIAVVALPLPTNYTGCPGMLGAMILIPDGSQPPSRTCRGTAKSKHQAWHPTTLDDRMSWLARVTLPPCLNTPGVSLGS